MAAENVALDLSWTDLTGLIMALTVDLTEHGVPDVVVGILRGGAIPAVQLAHRLGLRDVRAVEVTHTAADGPNAAKIAQPQMVNPASLGDLTGRDVLLVDDVAGSGDTLATARALVVDGSPARLRTVVCVLNEMNWAADDQVRPNYVGTYCRGWVRFPWEIR